MPDKSNMLAIDWLNPLRHVDVETYTAFWRHLYNTVLHGFWARFFFFSLMFLAFWTGVRSRNPTLAVVCLLLAAVIAYCGGLVDWVRTVGV